MLKEVLSNHRRHVGCTELLMLHFPDFNICLARGRGTSSPSRPLLSHLRDCDSSAVEGAVSHPYSSALSSPRYGRARFLMSKIWQRSRLWSVLNTGCIPLLKMSLPCVGWYLADQRTSPALLGVNKHDTIPEGFLHFVTGTRKLICPKPLSRPPPQCPR